MACVDFRLNPPPHFLSPSSPTGFTKCDVTTNKQLRGWWWWRWGWGAVTAATPPFLLSPLSTPDHYQLCHRLRRPPKGWGCSAVGRASDRHAAEAGSIPRCGKGFFSPSQLSVQTLTVSVHPPCAVACIYVCAHVKDPVVHVRARWITETLKHPACTVGRWRDSVAAGFHWAWQPVFPMGEMPLGQYSCKEYIKKNKKKNPSTLQPPPPAHFNRQQH